MQHKYYEDSTFVKDPETGKVSQITSRKKFVWEPEYDKFYMTFIEFMSPLFKLRGENAKNVLAWMCKNAEYNTGVVKLEAQSIDQIANELGIPKHSVYNSVYKLKKDGLIVGGRGRFNINPQIFWKGDLEVRRENIMQFQKMIITFELENQKEITP